MAQVSYPGVYIQEVPSGVRTITNVGTSITAFVDFFREGPMNVATEIFGLSDFGRVFGGIDPRSDASYAIAQFFLNGGSEAVVVRNHSTDPATPALAATVGVRPTNFAAPPIVNFVAASEGVWGNTLRVEVDLRTADPTKFFNLTVTRYASDQAGAAALTSEKHINLSLDPASSRDAVKVLAADSHLIRATVPNPPGANMPASNGTVSAVLPAGALRQPFLNSLRSVQPPGVPLVGRRLRIAIGAGSVFEATMPTWLTAPAPEVATLQQLASRLEQALRTAVDTTPAAEPTPPSLTGATVTVIGDSRLVITAGRGDPARAINDTIVFSNAAGPADNAATLMGLVGAGAAANVQQYPLGSTLPTTAGYQIGSAGSDGAAPNADALVGAVADANDRGIYALRKADLFNLLCIPRAATMAAEANGDTLMRQVVEKAIAFCESRRAFMLVDIPASINEVSEVKDWLDAHGNFRSRNSAVFFPRLRIADPAADYRLRSFGSSGTMAGLFARTDSDRGVWKAPAGIEATLRGVDDLDYRLTDAENGTLNPLAINCLRMFPVYGMVSWGARTLDGADQTGSEWKYIPIRRLALMLEESLFRGTKWVVFEPNDEPLWARIRLNIGAYMTSLFRQGAFQGTTPKDAFFVKCDAETTTQDDRNKGIVNIEVGFAPLKPAEFVVIKIQQIAGDL
ncbi:MAG: phage tail sheath C-terminal domain-containing protein [Caldimonas sp.]